MRPMRTMQAALSALFATGCVVSGDVERTGPRRAAAASSPAVSLAAPAGAVELGRVRARSWGLAGTTACQVRLLDQARELGADVLVVEEPGVSPCRGVAFALE